MTFLLELAGWLFFGYTALNVLYLTVWTWGAFMGTPDDRPEPPAEPDRYRRIAVLIPAYREDAVIVESVRANLRSQYPPERFDLVVIADGLQPETLAKLSELPVRVVEVQLEKSSVSNALRAAMAALPADGYDVALISDADNVLAPDFLRRINQAFARGWRVVQGHRTAKNTNTPTAILDAISEELNNFFFRKGHRGLGFSAALIGSGMAFEYGLFRTHIEASTAIGGYDKQLELFLLRDGYRIGYLESALVYDEKVQSPVTFEHQRTRWVEAQLSQVRLHFLPGLRAGLRGNADYANKALQTILLPRLLLLGSLCVGTLVCFVAGAWGWASFVGAQALLLATLLLLGLPDSLRQRLGPRVLVMVPVLFWRFCRSVLNVRKARNRFLHTPHGVEADGAAEGLRV